MADGPTVYRVFPDYHADPVWTAYPTSAMVNVDRLPISAHLRDGLRAWAREYEHLVGMDENRYSIVDADAHQAWLRDGAVLAERLQRALGPAFVVRYEAD